MSNWAIFLEFLGVYAAGVISPGPNFAMVVRTSLSNTRLTGIFISLGLSLSAVIQALLSVAGVEIVFKHYPFLLQGIQCGGGAYIAYLGILGLLAKKPSHVEEVKATGGRISLWKSFGLGFMTQSLNPYAWVFTFAIFVLYKTPTFLSKVLYVTSAGLIDLIWYAFIVLCLTHPLVQKKLFTIRHWIDRATGLFLLYVAFKIIFADISL